MSATSLHADFTDALADAGRDAPASIVARDAAERTRRFAVHRNTYAATLVAALEESFPVARQLLGDAFFRAMARERVLADPPRSPVLTEYAQTFPGYADAFAPLDAVPFVRDVLHLEATRIGAFHAADDAPLPVAELQAWLDDPAQLHAARVRLHAAARWLRCASAAFSLWQAHPVGAEPDTAVLASLDVDMREDVLVSRAGFDVRMDRLPPGGADLLDALAAGAALGDAFARAQATDYAGLFALLIDTGLIAGLALSEDA